MRMSITVSGSFHRHLKEVAAVVAKLGDLGVEVLSPKDPRIVACDGAFMFVASDKVHDVRRVQDGHLESIEYSDLLWVESPDGYAGVSVSMEIGFAVAIGVPVFSPCEFRDRTLREYVEVVADVEAAMSLVRALRCAPTDWHEQVCIGCGGTHAPPDCDDANIGAPS